ncbi:PucR family transcriptional regulator [Nonomuraea sp. NPDC050556]|uniref:PucR family transcriptional regulator n=1 Tax=Nonomuraea sp. NPDC050556 TaxID=3364369 RepID=UPI0037B8DEA1
MPDLHARMAPRVKELTARVVRRCAEEVPFYRELPREVLDGEVSRSVSAVFGLLLRALREPLTTADLTELIAWSARRAGERVPLEAALSAYLVGAEVWWQELSEVSRPGELETAGATLLSCLHTAVPGVALAHRQEEVRDDARKVRLALVTALLAGQPYEALAEAARVTVGQEHEVVRLWFPQQPPPGRFVHSALDACTGTLVLMDHVEGVALLPVLPDLAKVADAVGQPVYAAACWAATPADIPGAAEETARVMDLVKRLDRPPGLYRFDDVILEYQLARPGGGLARLAAKLDPLEGHPYLLETLKAFARRGHNRRQTALDLHIHRNTLDYRLHRVTALTGLDIAVPADARLLEAALTARELSWSPKSS